VEVVVGEMREEGIGIRDKGEGRRGKRDKRDKRDEGRGKSEE